MQETGKILTRRKSRRRRNALSSQPGQNEPPNHADFVVVMQVFVRNGVQTCSALM
jgi:hypothetical protein